jgi:hypothetical protein
VVLSRRSSFVLSHQIIILQSQRERKKHLIQLLHEVATQEREVVDKGGRKNLMTRVGNPIICFHDRYYPKC